MAFELIRDPETTEFKTVRVASQAYTRGDLVMLDRTSDATDVVPATSSSTTLNIFGVAAETVVSTVTSLAVIVVTPHQEWKVDVTNTSVLNNNYQRMVLTDARTMNNTGTDSTTSSGVFMQTGYTGATSDKKLIGRLLKVANITA